MKNYKEAQELLAKYRKDKGSKHCRSWVGPDSGRALASGTLSPSPGLLNPCSPRGWIN